MGPLDLVWVWFATCTTYLHALMDLHAAFSFSFSFHGERYSIRGGVVPEFKAKDGVLDFVPAGSGFEVAPRPVHLHNEASDSFARPVCMVGS